MTTVFERRYERRDTAANWSAANPVLASGEWGYDTTNKQVRMGDGTTAWNSLVPYSTITGDGTSVDVTAGVVSRKAISGDASIPAGSATITFGNVGPGATGPIGSTSVVPVVTINAKGLVTGLTSATVTPAAIGAQTLDATLTALAGNDWVLNSTPIGTGADTMTQLALAANTTAGRSSAGNIVAKSVTDAGWSFLAAANATAETALLDAATTSAKGLMSANDKAKLDNLWIDVTANSTALVVAGASATTNTTNINAIFTAAPNGSTIYFPPNATKYDFNGAWNMANKMFTVCGRGSNRAGSPPTAFSMLNWNANVGGDLIPLPGSGNGWYTQFRDLTFTASGADQASGAVINVNGNVGTNIQNCSFQSAGTFFNDVLVGSGGSGSNSWNSAVVLNCNIQGYKGTGIRCNASGSSLVVANTIIQGQWGGTGGTPAAAMATAGISGGFVGALQIKGCDVLGNINNLLTNPVLASSEVCASVFCENTYFDNSGGSCIKISGTGATVRAIFTGCSFTTAGTNFTTGGTGLSAVEIGGSFAYAAGGQSVSFTDCNILNTFGTVGVCNGVNYTGTSGDTYFTGCKVAGWASTGNGYNIAASGTNLTNVKILGGACGPAGGYGANTTGFNIAAGAYKGLQIQNVNAHGNTTNLTLGAVTVAAADASLFRITDNTGINPRGTVTTPAVGASTVAVTNTTGFRVTAYVRNGATSPTAYTVNGVVVTTFVSSAVSPTSNTFVIDPGGTIAFTYTVVPTWVWVAN